MPFDYDDPYTTINCRIEKATGKAVQIEDQSGTKCWIPRSCLHGGDDILIDESVGDDVQLRIRRWVAEREGLV